MHAHSPSRADFGRLSWLAGAGLTAIVVVAPLAYASTRPTPLLWLAWALHTVLGIWILALLFERRLPGVAPLGLAAAVALGAYVWTRFSFFEPGEISPFTAAHFLRIYDRWPESVIVRTPYRMTLLMSGFVAGFLVATDLTRRTVWRRALLFSMVATGATVALLGLVQNATHASGIFWEMPKHNMPSQFFATFYHFTSAGAFLNLTWPIAASMAFFAFKRHMRVGAPAAPVLIWTGLAALIAIGHLGHISRFPQAIAAAVFIVLVIIHRPFAKMSWTKTRVVSVAVITAIAACGVVWVAARSGKIGDIAARWRIVNILASNGEPTLPPARVAWPSLMRDDLVVPYDHSHYFLSDRGAAYQFAWEAFKIHPVLGFGPGGWISAVSQYTTDPTIGTFYHYLQFTHDDFLQTLVEWGLIGGVLCGILCWGAVRSAIKRLRVDANRQASRPELRPLILGALAALFAVWVQALIDFPLQIPANALYACILLAVCWSSAPIPASTKKHAHEQQSRRL